MPSYSDLVMLLLPIVLLTALWYDGRRWRAEFDEIVRRQAELAERIGETRR